MKSKKISLKADVGDYGIQKTITVSVNSASARELIILLSLLRERLTDTLEILLENFSLYLQVNKDENRSVCSFFNMAMGSFKGALSINSIEFALYFLLEYYRDELGGAEHIDLDLDYEKDSIVTLTIKVDAFKEISGEEMNKLLGV